VLRGSVVKSCGIAARSDFYLQHFQHVFVYRSLSRVLEVKALCH
jgi:hypothetical protein